MKNCVLLLVLLCSVSLVVQGKGKDFLLLNCGDTFDVDGIGTSKPLRMLAEALPVNPHVRQFRLVWGNAAPNMSISSTAIYQRNTRTLRFYSRTEVWGLGNEGVKPIVSRWSLKRASDAMIVKLARKHQRDDYDPGDSYFSTLTTMGAQKF